ncbi:hypothetical protein D3C71_2124880 [compost metagenome]
MNRFEIIPEYRPGELTNIKLLNRLGQGVRMMAGQRNHVRIEWLFLLAHKLKRLLEKRLVSK